MPAAIVQFKSQANNGAGWTGGTPVTLTFDTAVTTGNAVIAVVVQGVNNSHAVADATNGAYSQAHNNSGATPASSVSVFIKHNVTGGFTQVTQTPAASGTGWWTILEVSGLDSGATPVTGSSTDSTAASTTVYGASPGVSGTGIGVVGIQISANRNVTDFDSAGGWLHSSFTGGVTSRLSKRKAGTFSSDQGFLTVDSTAVAHRGAMVIFPETSSANPPGSITDLSATPISSTRIDLNWTAATGATSHTVQRRVQ